MTRWIVGSDEVGYGALAGPLYVAAVAVPEMWKLDGLKDSKKYKSRAHREAVFEPVASAVRGRWWLCSRSPEEIDRRGVYTCLLEAHTVALKKVLSYLDPAEDRVVIVDGNLQLPELPRALSVPKADALYPAVSAASVLAKVLRDQEMELQARTYPMYSFEANVGYGSPAHLEAIKTHGLCPLHRRSYKLKR